MPDLGAANVTQMQHFEPVWRRHDIAHQDVLVPADALGNQLQRLFAEHIVCGNDAG
ncbi:MAG: hypothetical protein HYU73_19785, partial [Betaproteobacteria bacterium]|nr:hypothetical protein [Betaproteobacteria bacterium]